LSPFDDVKLTLGTSIRRLLGGPSCRRTAAQINDNFTSSVDIDLVYLLVEDRPTTLRGIDAALQRIAAKIRRAMPGVQVREQKLARENLNIKLTVRSSGVPR